MVALDFGFLSFKAQGQYTVWGPGCLRKVVVVCVVFALRAYVPYLYVSSRRDLVFLVSGFR